MNETESKQEQNGEKASSGRDRKKQKSAGTRTRRGERQRRSRRIDGRQGEGDERLGPGRLLLLPVLRMISPPHNLNRFLPCGRVAPLSSHGAPGRRAWAGASARLRLGPRPRELLSSRDFLLRDLGLDRGQVVRVRLLSRLPRRRGRSWEVAASRDGRRRNGWWRGRLLEDGRDRRARRGWTRRA